MAASAATVQYGESALDIPDQTIVLLDMCEAFFGKAVADTLLRRGQAALRSLTTQQIVVTLPFEPLPTMDDTYELVVDFSGIDGGADLYDMHHGVGGAGGENTANDDGALAAAGGDAADNDNATGATTAADGEDYDITNNNSGAATAGSSSAHTTAQEQQYEVALLTALEQMGVADLMIGALRKADGGRAGGGPAADAADGPASLLSLTALLGGANHATAGNKGSGNNADAASSSGYSTSALSLALPPPAASLDQFGALMYPYSVYSPFTALRNATCVGGPSAATAGTTTTAAPAANGTATAGVKRYPAATLVAALQQQSQTDGSSADLTTTTAVNPNYYTYNDAIAERWRADGHANRPYVPYHDDYVGPQLTRAVQLQYQQQQASASASTSSSAPYVLPPIDDADFSLAAVDGTTTIGAIVEAGGPVGAFFAAAGNTKDTTTTLASALFQRNGIYTKVSKQA